jgi:hypothetical protein
LLVEECYRSEGGVEGSFDRGVGHVSREGDIVWGALGTMLVDDIEDPPCDTEHAGLVFCSDRFDVRKVDVMQVRQNRSSRPHFASFMS